MDIEKYIKDYNTYLTRLGYSPNTINNNVRCLNQFLSHLQAQNIKNVKEVQPKHILAYNAHLHTLKSRATNIGLAGSTIQGKINVIKQFSQFLELTEQVKILTIEVEIVPSIKQHRRIITQSQIKQLYDETDDSVTGMKETVILGLYYGCGLRYGEGIRLELNHIDYKKQLLYVSPSKNYQSRYVPINDSVAKDFLDYVKYARSCFEVKGNYFLSGIRSNMHLNKVLQKLCNKAGISQTITLHGLRHSIATHLLQQQMPLEQIAKFLGHTTLMATQIYTHIVNELNKPL